jgi:hypothetical protein
MTSRSPPRDAIGESPEPVGKHLEPVRGRCSPMEAATERVQVEARWLTPGVRDIGLASLPADLGHEIPTSLLPSFSRRRSAHLPPHSG